MSCSRSRSPRIGSAALQGCLTAMGRSEDLRDATTRPCGWPGRSAEGLALRLPRDDHRVLTARVAGDADQALFQTDRLRDRELSADERGDLLEAVFALVHGGDWDVPLRVLRRA